MKKKWMKFLLIRLLVMLIVVQVTPVSAFAQRTAGNLAPPENQGILTFMEYFERPVLVAYIAREYRHSVSMDKLAGSISIYDGTGAMQKTYYDVAYLGDYPVMDAAVLEYDMNWTLCKHVPDTDMFGSAYEAVLAGWLTYYKQSMEQVVTYYVSYCYNGWYFSLEPGAHTKSCSLQGDNIHQNQQYMVAIEKGNLTMEDDLLKEQIAKLNLQQIDQGLDSAMLSVGQDFFDMQMQPLLLEYIVRGQNATMQISALDNQVVITDGQGMILARINNLSTILERYVIDKALIERELGWENVGHQPDTSIFDSEQDAVLAGYLTLYQQSEGSKLQFYTGSCYEGHYFSKTPGAHEALCQHDNPMAHMHGDRPIIIENGRLFDEEQMMDDLAPALQAYADNKLTRTIKPQEAMTKMVTVFHTEYAKEDVQSMYFTNRDKVYRNYWEDLANYDVTDYIFIPPDYGVVPEAQSATDAQKEQYFRNQGEQDAAKLAEAVNALLAYRPNARVWIGTPGITSMNFSSGGVNADTYADYVKKVKWHVGEQCWQNNVVGLYINQESLYGTTQQQNTQIERIKNAITYFKGQSPDKSALWIPYYDQSQDKIARVAQMPDLFDYIIIQPGYFFFSEDDDATERKKLHVEAVKESAINNYVSDANGKAVGSENSNTIIGFEMETQSSYFSTSRETRPETVDRYTLYLMAGAQIKQTSPIAFYSAGDPHCNREYLVFQFYETDKELGYNAVRKRVDDNLKSFFDYVFENRENEVIFKEYARNLYLAADDSHTDAQFDELPDMEKVILAFYRYEKSYGIKNLAAHITDGGEIKAYFDQEVLGLLMKNTPED